MFVPLPERNAYDSGGMWLCRGLVYAPLVQTTRVGLPSEIVILFDGHYRLGTFAKCR
jgi:hypothetical protein